MKEVFGDSFELIDWLSEKEAYDYYAKEFKSYHGVTFISSGDTIYCTYEGYFIFRMQYKQRQLFLKAQKDVPYEIDNQGYSETLLMKRESNETPENQVQRKLFNEYNKFFFTEENYERRLTRDNFVELDKYTEKVCQKIDRGFDRYTSLISSLGVPPTDVTSLEIKVDNAFTLSELIELLDNYNKLYSAVWVIHNEGIEKAYSMDPEELFSAHELVLESIHIGSLGSIITNGAKAILGIVDTIIGINNKVKHEKRQLEKDDLDILIAKEHLTQEQANTTKALAGNLSYLDDQMQNATNQNVKNVLNNMLNDTITVINDRRGNGFDQRV